MMETDELAPPVRSDARPRYYGKYRGRVLNNVDPLSQGRVLVEISAVYGPMPSGWAMPCAPVAGLKAGFFAVPAIGSGVWIEFEAGDASRPIWVGGYWGVGETPNEPPAPSPPLPTQKIWRSDTGLTVAMDDVLQTVVVTDALSTNSVSIDVLSGTVTVSGLARVVLDAAVVQEGSAKAAHPGVKGDQLMAYLNQIVAMFNAHVHPGELALGFMPVTPAPPVAPLAPPPPTLISTKVFLE